MVIILREQNFNTNSFRCDMDQQQQQQQQDRQLRELHVEEGTIELHHQHHEGYHHHHLHHHLQEEETQLQRAAAGLYWKMTGGLVLTSGLLFGSCVFCKLVTTRDVLLALLATLLLWSAVTLLTTFRADLDLTGPSFLNGCLTPLLLFILYLLLWLGYCRCRSSSSPGQQQHHHHHHQQTTANSPPPVDFEQHLIMVTVIEVVIVLSIVLIISQWLSGRSRHLLTIVASCRPYSLLLLFWCLLLLEALLLLLVIFIRRQTSSPSDHHHHHQHHTASAS